MNLMTIDTPALILDEAKMDANIARMRDKATSLGVTLRPHLKTSKCWEVAKRQIWTPEGPATVSTLKEAEEFAAHGIKDMIYAVGIAPQKLPRVAALIRQDVDLKIILDNVEAAQAVSRFCQKEGMEIKVLIEIDCDGHRSGLKPNDPEMIAVAQSLTDGAHFMGVLTHAGESYNAHSQEEIEAAAENEECSILAARDLLASAGFTSTIVSVGSTPTFVRARRHLAGVTEYRSGVGAFYDLVMAGIGVCRPEDIALSVQETAFAMLTEVTERAMAHIGKDEVLLGGGVAQNNRLREMVAEMAHARGAEMYVPDRRFCMDNGAMIAWLGAEMYNSGVRMDVSETAVRQRFRTDEVEVTWRS